MEVDFREVMIRCLEHAPMVALADCTDPEMVGLPATDRTQLLLLRFPEKEDRELLQAATGATFPYAYGTGDGRRAEVAVPWTSLVAVTGIMEPGKRGTFVRSAPHLPAYLGRLEERPVAIQRMLRPFAAVRPAAAWRIGVAAASVERRPDKREALVVLADDSKSAIGVMIRPDVEGVSVSLGLPAEMPVVVLPIAHDELRIRGVRVDGRLQGDQGPTGAVSLPWNAIVAMQDMNTGLGWFWPDDFPDGVLHRIAPDLGPASLAGHSGLPLLPPDPLPLLALPAAPEADKRRAILACQRQGGAILLVSTRAEGVHLPGDFAGVAMVAVPLGLPPELGEARTEMTGLYIRTTMPDFSGTPQRLTLPWNSIFAASTNEGTLRVHAWPADYPPPVSKLMHDAARLRETGQALVEGGPAPQADGISLEAPGLSLTEQDGQVRALLVQPIGPVGTDGTQPRLEMEFLLPTLEGG
jgi:hypothetical protein